MSSKYFDSGIKLSEGFSLSGNKPLDTRSVCETISDLESIPSIQLYDGMIVYVEAEECNYQYYNNQFNPMSTKQVKNDLGSDDTTVGLSAAMGKNLQTQINNLDSTQTESNGKVSVSGTDVADFLINKLQSVVDGDNEYAIDFTQSGNKLNISVTINTIDGGYYDE